MRLAGPALLAFFVLVGCTASPPADTSPAITAESQANTSDTSSTVAESTVEATTTNPEPTVLTGSLTIEEVWEEIGCDEGDPFSRTNDADPPLLRQGTCYPYGGDEAAYFFELSSADAVESYLRSGALEVGSGDALYVDGAVVILATDAATAQRLGEDFTPAQ